MRFFSLLLLLSTALGYGCIWPQRRTNDLPSSGPPNLEANYEPWYRVRRPRRIAAGWVRDFQPTKAEKRRLVLSREDQEEFAHLINQPNAGGFRLLTPHPTHPVGTRVVSIDNPEFSRRPGFSSYASRYSFTRRKHGHGVNGWDRNTNWNLIDLRLLRRALLAAVTEESVGLIVQLGDVPLEEVTEQTTGVPELAELTPPPDHHKAVVLYEKHLCGYRLNGLRYGLKAIAVVNNTYVLRSILNQRADQLIAFRIVREDEEGSLSIVWRKLKTYPKPFWAKQKQVNEYRRTYKPCPQEHFE